MQILYNVRSIKIVYNVFEYLKIPKRLSTASGRK